MPNYKRYEVASPWRAVDEMDVGHGCGDPRAVVVEIADLRDKQTGDVWRQGAYRVRPVMRPGFKPAVYFGETAWSDAQRKADDETFAQRRRDDRW